MEVPRHWRLQKQRYALQGEVCPHCDAKIFPARDVCPECGGEAKEPFRFSGRGEVYSYTVMNNAPAGFERGLPYTVALVKLEEGPPSPPSSPTWDPSRCASACRWKWSRAASRKMVTSAACSSTATSLDP